MVKHVVILASTHIYSTKERHWHRWNYRVRL